MNAPVLTLEKKQRAFAELREIKSNLAVRGWFPATSGNLSIRISDASEELVFAVTASGKDKAVNTPEDFMLVGMDGLAIEPTSLKPSAETLIHCELYKHTGCGAVLHVHTVWNNLASALYADEGYVPVDGVELIKAFQIWEENASIQIPILPNYADIPRIANLVKGSIIPKVPGILLQKHGIYTWGANMFEAKRNLEAFEFLFEYAVRLKQIRG